MISIKIWEKVSEHSLDEFNQLMNQLSKDFHALSPDDLTGILNSESSMLFVAVQENKIIGSLTLVFFQIPTGHRCRIEDVVVDENWRSKGIGASLISHALSLAKSKGYFRIELTSRPTRWEANRLYKRLGFELRETNVYMKDLN